MSQPLQEALQFLMVVLTASVVVAAATVVVAHTAMARQDWRQRDLPVWEAVGFGLEDARAWARARTMAKQQRGAAGLGPADEGVQRDESSPCR